MLKQVLSSVIVMAAASAALAQHSVSPYYGGVQIGYAMHYGFDNPGKDDSAGVVFATYAPFQGDFSARLSVGYQFNDYFGIEVGQGTYGQQLVAYGGTETGSRVTGKTPSAKVLPKHGFDLSLTGHMPLTDRITAVAKVGMARLDIEADAWFGDDVEEEGFVRGLHYDIWHSVLRGELGLEYRIARNTAVSISYAHYYGVSNNANVLNDETDSLKKVFTSMDPRFGMLSLGMTHHF